MRTIASETAFQGALRNCSKEQSGGKVSVTYDLSEGRMCSQAHILAEVCCSSQGADVTVNDFSAFLDTRRCKNWAHKIFWKYLSEDLFCQFFPEHRMMPHSWSQPWTPFRGCWKSAAAAAHDLILVEVDSKCQFVVGTGMCLSTQIQFWFPLWMKTDSLIGSHLQLVLPLFVRISTVRLQYLKIKEMPKWVSSDSRDSSFCLTEDWLVSWGV